jgi:hypothetical protein
MNILGNPKSAIWVCRLVPAVFWALWLATLLSHGRAFSITVGLSLVSLGIYVPFVYRVLPVLLFGGTSLSLVKRIAYFIFTGVTVGIGPVIWYFVSVDGVLRRMAKNQ